jgi:hypothetical protein
VFVFAFVRFELILCEFVSACVCRCVIVPYSGLSLSVRACVCVCECVFACLCLAQLMNLMAVPLDVTETLD